MASADRAKSTPDPAASGASKDAADVEAQLKKIKADIAELGSTLSTFGSNRVKDARGEADQRISDLTQASEDALDDARRKLRSVERDLSTRTRQRPLQTLGIAVGVGFFLALIWRR